MTTPTLLSRRGLTLRDVVVEDRSALRAMDMQAHGNVWSHATFARVLAAEEFRHIAVVPSTNRGGVDAAPIAHAASWRDGHIGRIVNVAVHEDHHRCGIAGAMLEHLIASMLAHEETSELRLEVRPRNKPAQLLYAGFGFVPTGVERDFYERSIGWGSRDAMVMTVSDVNEPVWRSGFNTRLRFTGAA